MRALVVALSLAGLCIGGCSDPTSSAANDARAQDGSPLGDTLLSCQSLDTYKRLSDFDFNRNGVFLPWADHEMPQALKDNFVEISKGSSPCEWLNDDGFPTTSNTFHVEKVEQGYWCIRRRDAQQCYWTTASKLKYVGRGPQLTDEQFAEVLRLYAVFDAFNRVSKEYWDRSDELIWEDKDDGKLRVLNAAQKREASELEALAVQAYRRGDEMLKKSEKIVPLSHGDPK
jgi:hypothetical protein